MTSIITKQKIIRFFSQIRLLLPRLKVTESIQGGTRCRQCCYFECEASYYKVKWRVLKKTDIQCCLISRLECWYVRDWSVSIGGKKFTGPRVIGADWCNSGCHLHMLFE